MTARRIVSVWLLRFPIQRWRRRNFGPQAGEEDDPLVLSLQGPHGPVIHDLNAAAVREGLSRGGRVTDAKTRVPGLLVAEANPEADASDLKRLAAWSRRWCPWTRADGTDGLLLDTTGSDHLKGGEAAMLADMLQAFAASGLTARLAVAPTTGAAWALARRAPGVMTVCREGETAERLARLPVEALRLDGETALLLNRLGLKTIGAVAAVPREALMRRFRSRREAWRNPVIRLDQAFGRLAEPLKPGLPDTPMRAMKRLVEPVGGVENVTVILKALLDDLCPEMEKRGAGARRLKLTGYRTDGGTSSVYVAVSRASREAAHLAKLFAHRIDRLDCGYGFDAMTLDVMAFDPMDSEAQDLEGKSAASVDVTRLIDRLTARLGPEAVMRPVAQGSHLPERAEIYTHAGKPGGGAVRTERARPLRLLQYPQEAQVLYAVPEGPPARLVWQRRTRRLVRSEGPERIAPEWWREKSTTRLRDYYRVEDEAGRRYWIYREGLPDDGRGGSPRWFVHGLDA